jgi:hypothetical protein
MPAQEISHRPCDGLAALHVQQMAHSVDGAFLDPRK